MELAPIAYLERPLEMGGGVHGVDALFVRSHLILNVSGQSGCEAGGGAGDGAGGGAGRFTFGAVTLLAGAVLWVSSPGAASVIDGGVTLAVVADFQVTGDAVLNVPGALTVYAGWVRLEAPSSIDGCGGGHPSETGTGRGCALRVPVKPYLGLAIAGGAHANYGGKGASSVGRCPYQPYGDLDAPRFVGSGGGACQRNALSQGGAGGAAVMIAASHLLVIEGNVSMNGSDGRFGAGGGGGGSVWLDAPNIEGWGRISANGGRAGARICLNPGDRSCDDYCVGGRGSAGRVRLSTSRGYISGALLGGIEVAEGGVGLRGSLSVGPARACNSHGTRDALTSACACAHGYAGVDCQFVCDATTTCGGRGACGDHGQCECDADHVGLHCETPCSPNASCSDHGVCSPCGHCLCAPCYDAPNCSALCSAAGVCQRDRCVCAACHHGDYCELVCGGHGTCGGVGGCACEEGWRGALCTRPACPGLQLDCSGHGACNAANHSCYCEPGWSGELGDRGRRLELGIELVFMFDD